MEFAYIPRYIRAIGKLTTFSIRTYLTGESQASTEAVTLRMREPYLMDESDRIISSVELPDYLEMPVNYIRFYELEP